MDGRIWQQGSPKQARLSPASADVGKCLSRLTQRERLGGQNGCKREGLTGGSRGAPAGMPHKGLCAAGRGGIINHPPRTIEGREHEQWNSSIRGPADGDQKNIQNTCMYIQGSETYGSWAHIKKHPLFMYYYALMLHYSPSNGRVTGGGVHLQAASTHEARRLWLHHHTYSILCAVSTT